MPFEVVKRSEVRGGGRKTQGAKAPLSVEVFYPATGWFVARGCYTQAQADSHAADYARNLSRNCIRIVDENA